ncbi:MaoC family dehydratase N-terminal domain-containing protein [Comamonas sp. J-3]|uniref:MaoC family dehydratase N-terminal domain-containing protein n=1 Tax=Comamonas trifloxystrobinivorans TaxID=3350256 RepID=UPI00372C3E36
MIDRRFIGHVLTPFTAVAEVGRLRFFAKAVGENNPIYSDLSAAQAAGHPSLPLPPTFLFSMEFEAPNPAETQQLLGMDLRRILHGEQHFRYRRMAHAGEELRFQPRITDIYDKKNGALEFVVRDTDVTDANGLPVAELRRVIVLRNA